MTIEGVPESVPLEKVVEMLATLGIDAKQVTTEGIRITRDAVEVTVFALDGAGRRYIGPDRDGAATHHLCIRIDR